MRQAVPKPKSKAKSTRPKALLSAAKSHRPSDPTKYDAPVVYYVTGDMKKALQDQAREAGLKLSDYLRVRDRQLGVGGYRVNLNGRTSPRGGK
jgi:hypothetical protein